MRITARIAVLLTFALLIAAVVMLVRRERRVPEPTFYVMLSLASPPDETVTETETERTFATLAEKAAASARATRFESVTQPGAMRIQLKLPQAMKPNEAMGRLEDLEHDLPQRVTLSTTLYARPSMHVRFTSSSASTNEITERISKLRLNLLATNDFGSIDLCGGREPAVMARVDADRLVANHETFHDLYLAVTGGSVDPLRNKVYWRSTEQLSGAYVGPGHVSDSVAFSIEYRPQSCTLAGVDESRTVLMSITTTGSARTSDIAWRVRELITEFAKTNPDIAVNALDLEETDGAVFEVRVDSAIRASAMGGMRPGVWTLAQIDSRDGAAANDGKLLVYVPPHTSTVDQVAGELAAQLHDLGIACDVDDDGPKALRAVHVRAYSEDPARALDDLAALHRALSAPFDEKGWFHGAETRTASSATFDGRMVEMLGIDERIARAAVDALTADVVVAYFAKGPGRDSPMPVRLQFGKLNGEKINQSRIPLDVYEGKLYMLSNVPTVSTFDEPATVLREGSKRYVELAINTTDQRALAREATRAAELLHLTNVTVEAVDAP